jgi:hypothetical protein
MVGHCERYPTDPKSIEGQSMRFEYPAPGHSEVKLYHFERWEFGEFANLRWIQPPHTTAALP